MRQLEGGWYSADSITKSKQRVDRLGYFTEVNVETPSVPGTTDQVDLNLSVAEKPTGNILLGAGYGSSEGIILSGGVSQQNVFGSGNFLGVQLNTSKVNTVYSLSFTQPYWTVDGVSRGFDLYKRVVDPTAINAGAYRTSTIGAQARLGIPFTDIDTISLGFGYESTSITAFRNCDPAVCIDSPLRILTYVDTFGTDNTAILGSVGWARDTRDSAIYPTRGGTQRASVEAGLPGGTLQYYKLSYQNQRYFPLSRDFTLYLNGDVGYGNGLLGKPLPFFRNYYAGGVSSVRGFYTSTIGPKDANAAPIGGSKKLVGNVELLFPFPGLANDKSVRLSAFVDAGLIGESYAFRDTRVGAGFAVLWVSPFGPIKISVAQPFRSQADDQKQRFQFTFGQQF
jgi:outer membrane protein insertion porin family